jgi:2-amino-4-hydroxy-6-hydroxymethyldihydropteridine diphosphokinase
MTQKSSEKTIYGQALSTSVVSPLTEPPAIACIGLGSNLGDSMQILHNGWKRLGRQKGISLQALSAPYRSKPVDMESKHWFINAAGVIKTILPPETLLKRLLFIEQDLGRIRDFDSEEHQDRTLDLDLLLYNDLVLKTPCLQIPHPQMHKRLFVLAPLAEVASDMIHPVRQLSIETLKQGLLNNRQSKKGQEVYRITASDW